MAGERHLLLRASHYGQQLNAPYWFSSPLWSPGLQTCSPTWNLDGIEGWAMAPRVFLCSPSFSCFALVLLASGCVSGGQWEQPRDQARPIKPSDPVWIWSNGTVEKWHGVVITPDSVSGIPYDIPLTCDTCRRSISRAQVDSLKYRTGGVVGKTSLQIAGVVAAGLLVEQVVSWCVRSLER